MLSTEEEARQRTAQVRKETGQDVIIRQPERISAQWMNFMYDMPRQARILYNKQGGTAAGVGAAAAGTAGPETTTTTKTANCADCADCAALAAEAELAKLKDSAGPADSADCADAQKG